MPISFKELILAIDKSNNKSAPGVDLISYSVLKNLLRNIYPWLCELLNSILDQGLCPPEWNIYKVALISKPGNSGFRPICTSCCLLKIVERIINERFQ